jgi:rubrerythrin
MWGLLKLLFGGKNKYQITCPVCGKQGGMFKSGGAYKGIFEIVGKTSNGGLAIKECPSCKTKLAYNPLSGRVTENKDF